MKKIQISKIIRELPLLLQEVENEAGKRDLVIVFPPNKGHRPKINLSSNGEWIIEGDTLQVLIKVSKIKKEEK